MTGPLRNCLQGSVPMQRGAARAAACACRWGAGSGAIWGGGGHGFSCLGVANSVFRSGGGGWRGLSEHNNIFFWAWLPTWEIFVSVAPPYFGVIGDIFFFFGGFLSLSKIANISYVSIHPGRELGSLGWHKLTRHSSVGHLALCLLAIRH